MNICKDCHYCHNPWYYKIFSGTPDCLHIDAHNYRTTKTNSITGVQKLTPEFYSNCIYERSFGECGPKGKNFKQKDL